MPPPEISVLIPAWRATGFLRECLDSVFAQEPGGFEVVVGVDGCPATLDYLLREKASRRPSLRILRGQENRGAYVTRNTLARAARADYLVFFDADDIMLPGLIRWCETRREAREVSQFRFVQALQVVRPGVASRAASPVGARGAFGIRRDSFLSLGGFQGWPCSADTEFQRRASRILGRPALSPSALFIYRRHRGSLTRSPNTGVHSQTRRLYQHRVARMTDEQLCSPIDAPIAEMEEVAP